MLNYPLCNVYLVYTYVSSPYKLSKYVFGNASALSLKCGKMTKYMSGVKTGEYEIKYQISNPWSFSY